MDNPIATRTLDLAPDGTEVRVEVDALIFAETWLRSSQEHKDGRLRFPGTDTPFTPEAFEVFDQGFVEP